MKKYLFIVLFLNTFLIAELKMAFVGECYQISGSYLALLKTPKVSTITSVNQANIIVEIDHTINIQIIKTEGIIDRYFYVNIIRDGKIKLSGWIWSKAITKYNKITEKEAYFVKPIKIYSQDSKPIDKEVKIEANLDSIAIEHARLDFDHKIDFQLMMDFQSKKASLDRIAFAGTFATAFYNPIISVLAYFLLYDKMPNKYLIKLSDARLKSPYYTGLNDNQKNQYEESYKSEAQYYLQRRIIVSGYKGCQLSWIPFLLFIT